ncbi:MAG: bifunctional [glutamine synthetase] adenylyltransferase/[glutamine synthetase]-adenylyl-L-tyrosine phosphorylase [Pseudomonadota bacterium]|nr:bifunctional [glutamine synthetase] adenylyltransferase/[glutamine synthetase]-adenylyl-L-tyrosine phosphorylase [Pseudomonadota bacterium]
MTKFFENWALVDGSLPLASNKKQLSVHLERWSESAKRTSDESIGEFAAAALEDGATWKLLSSVFGNSPFLSNCLISDQEFSRILLIDGPDVAFSEALSVAGNRSKIAEETIDQAKRRLRIAKRRAALAIGIADIANMWSLDQITGALSDFAGAALSGACQLLLRHMHDKGALKLTDPDDPEKDSGLIVLGMGKLGARELNYSSDIDLIILYDQEVVPYTGEEGLQRLFTRFSRDLVSLMSERTADGYVFRTDLRLRPDPGATPPALSVLAAETYYESTGQNWERAAMIKARPVAGDKQVGLAFLDMLRPFIWRRSLDFAAIQDIQSIKRQINTHRGRAEIAILGHNIKLGSGGIREIEFYSQTQQLIWGGRDPELRVRGTLLAIERLVAAGHVDHGVFEDLKQAYLFHRRVEHRLQMIEDRQTHELPENEDGLKRLAIFLGYDGLALFTDDLLHHLKCVERHYAALFENEGDLSGTGNLVFTGAEDDPDTLKTLSEMGFAAPETVLSTVRIWHTGRYRAIRSTRARELLTELVPAILEAFSASPNPDLALRRFNEFLEGLPAGVQLFSLFTAHPGLFDLVAEIMGAAPRLAGWLSRNPILLDGVLSRDFFDFVPGRDQMVRSLADAAGEARDFQEFMDIQRRWANDGIFQIGAHMLRGRLAPVDASLPLSDIADTCLISLLPEIGREFERDHGRIPGGMVAVVALGKLGSREMTPGSDLDLLMVYECPPGVLRSDGARPLSPGQYYTRLCQRFIGAITAPTGEGKLYEVDMRLRPDGNAGPIASSLEAFGRYQENDAWTWEHQALTRARVVYAEGDLGDKVRRVIRSVLTARREDDQIIGDIGEMRGRMRKEHDTDNIWSVKHARGGIVDIEFITQYLQLKYAADTPEILAGDTSAVLLVAVEKGFIDAETASDLDCAMKLWRNLQSILRLTVDGDFNEEGASVALKRMIVKACGAASFNQLKQTILVTSAKNAAHFSSFFGRPGN